MNLFLEDLRNSSGETRRETSEGRFGSPGCRAVFLHEGAHERSKRTRKGLLLKHYRGLAWRRR